MLGLNLYSHVINKGYFVIYNNYQIFNLSKAITEVYKNRKLLSRVMS